MSSAVGPFSCFNVVLSLKFDSFEEEKNGTVTFCNFLWSHEDMFKFLLLLFKKVIVETQKDICDDTKQPSGLTHHLFEDANQDCHTIQLELFVLCACQNARQRRKTAR